MASTPGKQDPKWVEIADFRPGIISQAKFAYGAGDNSNPVPWLGPPGAAQAAGTQGCIALANGGLAPLPGVQKTVESGFTPANGGTSYINGVIIHGLGATDEVIYGIENITGGFRQFQLTSYIDEAATTSVIKSLGPTADSSGDGIAPLTGALTRVNPWKAATTTADMPAGTPVTSIPVNALVSAVAAGDSLQVGSGATVMAATASAAAGIGATAIPVLSVTPAFDLPIGTTVVDLTALTEPGQPCVAIAYTFIANPSATAYNWLYPDPSNPGSFSLFDFPNAPGGLCLTHQNRVVFLLLNNYLWAGVVGGVTTLFPTDETFVYTDPPNSEMLGTQNEVFVAEHPGGVGAWGSIQTGELFMVKNTGGAFIISGDLNSPIITFLGGVTPTFNVLADAAQTVVGLVYASKHNGVWAWQGGTTAEKISNNLNDDFWENPSAFAPIGFSADGWGDWVCMTNGWLFDTANGGWWQLADPGFTPMYFGVSADGTGMWAVALDFTSPTDPVLARYDFATPGNSYSWTSYPLKETINHICEVQEIVLRAQGDGEITITLEGPNGSGFDTIPATVTVDSIQPVLYRLGVACQAHDITINISATGAGGGPAPTVYSVSLMFVEGAPVNELGASL